MVNEPLRRLLSREAPGTSVQFSPPPRENLASGTSSADLLVAPVGFGMVGPHDVVLRDHFVAVVSRENVPDPDRVDVVDMLGRLPHAVAVFGEGVVTPADRLLEQLDVRRKVAATVSGFVSLPMLVVGTDLVALVPYRLAERFAVLGSITVLELPESSSTPLIEAIYWDPARTADPALQWLRGAFLRACEPLSRESAT